MSHLEQTLHHHHTHGSELTIPTYHSELGTGRRSHHGERRTRPSHRHAPPPEARNIHEVSQSVMGPGHIIGERVVGSSVVNTYIKEGQTQVMETAAPASRIIQRADLSVRNEEPEIREEIEYVPVDVVVERKVPVKKFVDVPYDVHVRKEVKKIIEKERVIEQIEEVPVEKIVEYEVEKVVKVPKVEYVDEVVEVEKVIKVPVTEVVTNQHARIGVEEQKHQEVVEVNITELESFKAKHRVDQVLETDVRIHNQKKIVEVPDYQVNLIKNAVNVPVYSFQHEVERVTVPYTVTQIDEVPAFDHDTKTHVKQERVERHVPQPYEVKNEVPSFEHGVATKRVETVVDKKVEKPFTVTIRDEVPRFEHDAKHRETVHEVPDARFKIHEEVRREPVHVDVPVPLMELNLESNPVFVEEAHHAPGKVESAANHTTVHSTRVQPETKSVHIHVPKANRVPHENLIEVEVPVEIVTEVPVAVEKNVEVKVQKVVEVPRYTEKEVKVNMPYDVIIKRKIERLKPVYVDQVVKKQVTVPVKVVQQRAEEVHEAFEQDMNVDTVDYVPSHTSQMRDRGTFQVDNEELAQRIHAMNEQCRALEGEVQHLRSQVHHTAVDHSHIERVNRALRDHAHAHAKHSDMQSEVHALEHQLGVLNAYLEEVKSHPVATETLSVLHPDHHRKVDELNALIREHKDLIMKCKARAHGGHHAPAPVATHSGHVHRSPVVTHSSHHHHHAPVVSHSGHVHRSPVVVHDAHHHHHHHAHPVAY